MKYMGSKNRIARDILEIIFNDNGFDKQNYIEPFVGGANIIDKVREYNPTINLFGYDANKYLIALFNYVKENDIEFYFLEKEEFYEKYKYPFKDSGEIIIDGRILEDWEIGFIGFTKTFNAMFMKGYAGKYEDKRNFQIEGFNNLIKQKQNILDIEFNISFFQDLIVEDNSIIYLDPPYQNTAGYNNEINHLHLYEWACNIKDSFENVDIYLSEKTTLGDRFECIWEKDIVNQMSQTNSLKMNEKLFKLI